VHEHEGSTHQGEESLMTSCREVGDGALMIWITSLMPCYVKDCN